MVPFWLQFVLVVLATCQLVETLRHGSIFATFRAWLESRGPFWAELIGCGFCFSHWAAAATAVIWCGHVLLAAHGYEINPCLFVIVWLAAVRGSNLLNDMTKAWSRTPSADELNIAPLDIDEDELNGPGAATTTGSEPD